MNRFRHHIAYQILTILAVQFIGAGNLFGEDPPQEPQDELIIVLNVDHPFDFPLDVPSEITDLSASNLPGGISFDPLARKFFGTPAQEGVFTGLLSFVEAGASGSVNVVFDIRPADEPIEPPFDGSGDGPPEPVVIFGIVGESLHFPLPYDSQLAQVDFGVNPDGTPSVLPLGLQFDPTTGSMTGVPAQPGQTDFTLIIFQEGDSWHMPIVFDIQGSDGGPPSDPPADEPPSDPIDDLFGDPVAIHGFVGEPLQFPLPYDSQLAQVDFGVNPDGTPSALPPGLQFDATNGLITGVPEQPGRTDFTLILFQGGDSWHMPIVFEIDGPGGSPDDPSSDPIWIFGYVGQPLYYQLPYNAQSSQVEFDHDADGTPSLLPPGLQIDPNEGAVVGTPIEPGLTDLALIIQEGDSTFHMPLVFDIQPLHGDGSGNPTGSEPVVIFGIVGEPLAFPLPYDVENSQVDFAPTPTGVPSILPPGLEFDPSSGSILGTPQEPGYTDFAFLIFEGEDSWTLPVVFEIGDEGADGGWPGDPNGGIHPMHVVGNVGEEFSFPLPMPPGFTDFQFDSLPEGLNFDYENLLIVGSPLFPGYWESGLFGILNGEEVRIPVFFDIFGDFHSDDGTGREEIKIHGFVGEFLSFPLPFPIELVELELTQFADGGIAELPVGIELDAPIGLVVGFPQEPGFYESSLTVWEEGERREVPIFFDIQHPFNPGGHPPLPPYEEDYENEDILLFGAVGTRFSFQFPVDGDEQFELPDSFDGVPYRLPPGLSFNADHNTITGSPSESGVFETLVLILRPDHEHQKVLRFLISDSGDAPKLSPYTENEVGLGQPFSFPILASGNPTQYHVIDGLPEGVDVDGQTGLISGLLDFEDDFDLIVKASNEAGSAYGILFLDVDTPRPDDHPPSGGEGEVDETEPFPGRVGVPFRLQAPEEYANAVFTVIEGESFPAGLRFDPEENAVISGTPAEAGHFKTRILIDREGQLEEVILTFFIFDDPGAPQFVSEDYLRIRPGETIEFPLIVANGPADISIETDLSGISLDSASSALRGSINEPGFYTVLALAENESGSSIHIIDIDVWDDGSHGDPNHFPNEPFYIWGHVGQFLDFPLPADPFRSEIAFAVSDDGTTTPLPQGLEFLPEHALIRGVPEVEGRTELFLEITEFGFTRREHLIFEIQHSNDFPDHPGGDDPRHDEPDDGRVEPIVGKVGERLFFEAPISGENISFELVPGPDGEESELPPGIVFDGEAGILSGVPTRSGIYPIWVTVDDNGHVRTHFAPLLISGPEGAPEITSDDFISLNPGEHFEYEVTAKNEPTRAYVEFFDAPGILSFDEDSMILKGKFEFGGFFTLLIVAENEAGTGYGLLNVDVLGFNDDGTGVGGHPLPDIPLRINGMVGEQIDHELPSYVRGSSFAIELVQVGITYSAPEDLFPEGLELDPKTGRISGIPLTPGGYFVRVKVDDGALPSLAINIGIVDSLPTPKIVSSDWMVGHEEAPFHYFIYATDFPFEFFATGLPDGLTLDPSTGIISGTPTEAGEFQVLLSARNDSGVGEERLLHLRIEEKPRFPVLSAPHFSEGQVGEAFALQVEATHEPDAFHAFGLPFGLSIDSSTGLISGTPEQDGFFEVHLEAHNQWGLGAFRISILVKRAALAPIYIGPRDLAGKVGQPFFFNPPIQGAASEFSISENSPNPLPAGLNIDPITGLISGSPEEQFNGVVELVIRGEGGSVIVPVSLNILPGLEAPVITSEHFARGTAGQSFSYQILATNNPTEFKADGLPAGLSLNEQSGQISGNPESAGYFDLVIQARNSSGWGRPKLLILDIIPALEAPIVVSAPFAKGKVGEPFSYQTLATNSPSSFLAVGSLPEGISLNPTTGLISGTPTQAGRSEVILAASNVSGLGNGMVLILSIQPSQEMPRIISSGTAFGKVNEPFQYRIIATGEPTSYQVENLPDGLALNEETGFITGTPVQATTEPIVLVVYASNAAGTSLPRVVILEILPSKQAPEIISGGYAIGKAGQEFQFQVFATNNPTSFFSPKLPQGLSIASDTGLISGTPQAAGEFEVILQASNSAGAGDPSLLILFILPGAEMPQITSAPYARGKVGEAFSYQIETTAETIDSYQVLGELPRGLDFDPVTGLISGTPIEPGFSEVELTATNEAGTSLPQSLIMKIEPDLAAPVIISSLHARGRVGTEFSYEIQATNMPDGRPLPQGSEFDAIGLPLGLGINQATGVISGTPEEAGRFPVEVVATNASGQGNPKTLVLEIHPSLDAPEIFSASKVAAQVGEPFNYEILATNLPSAYDVEHAISWLNVDTTTGFLSGSPDEPGVHYAEMVAENESGQSEFAPLYIVVYPAEGTPKIISDRQAEGQIGAEFQYQILGTETPTSFVVNGLPSGLSLNAETGLISGVPTASGEFEIVMAASNANGIGSTAAVVLKIRPRTELNIVVTDNNG